MFSIRQIKENDFDKVVLVDDEALCSAEIVPGCGAILHAFIVKHDGVDINIIDSYESARDFKENHTAKGFKGSKLSPFVCRMKEGKYHYGREDHRIEKFYLGENAIHGVIFDTAFTVIAQQAEETHASVTMKHEYRKEDKGYPFDYDCIVTYTLEKNNRLTVHTSVVNKSDGLIPVQDGWHPYFNLGGSINDLQFEFQSKELVEFDEQLIPTGRLIPYQEFGSLRAIGDLFLDNCFTLNFHECQPRCVLRNRVKKIQLEICPDQSYTYLQIYTPPHRNSIAIENISGAPDGFNNGMGVVSLEAGKAVEFFVSYQVRNV